MADPDENVSDETRATEQEDEHLTAGADRPATEEEEAAAERAPKPSGDVGEHYREQNEVGANVEGEGQID